MLTSVFHWLSTLCSAARAAASAAVWAFVAIEVDRPSQSTSMPAASRATITTSSKSMACPCSSRETEERLRIPRRESRFVCERHPRAHGAIRDTRFELAPLRFELRGSLEREATPGAFRVGKGCLIFLVAGTELDLATLWQPEVFRTTRAPWGGPCVLELSRGAADWEQGMPGHPIEYPSGAGTYAGCVQGARSPRELTWR